MGGTAKEQKLSLAMQTIQLLPKKSTTDKTIAYAYNDNTKNWQVQLFL